MSKKLIIATSLGYQFYQIELFLSSLNRVYHGHLLLLTDQKYKLRNYNFLIEIGDISSDFYQTSLTVSLNSANNKRLFYAEKFIQNNFQYEQILLTDIRDVVFQEDPFNAVLDEKLQVAAEDVLIGENEYNLNWIKALMGEDYLESIKHQKVFCSGTILGNREIILKYLKYVTELVAQKGAVLDSGLEYFVADQAAFNAFCYENSDLIRIHSNTTGKIFTMSYTSKIILSGAGTFINDNAQQYAIIHQYDRYNFLIDMLKKKYGIFGWQDFKNAIKLIIGKCL
ncbi:MAG: hypothetical protein H7321_08745 [Bacteroidia bacterium]|nr:hypothetical protein [Bacteroidia bacterium]